MQSDYTIYNAYIVHVHRARRSINHEGEYSRGECKTIIVAALTRPEKGTLSYHFFLLSLLSPKEPDVLAFYS